MNDTPFTTVGDEPVEARIVAWVLGEASAFEVAELERLCEERPELQVFKRRMIAIHGLLIEASQADDSWKLSPEKRKVLDEILDREKVVSLEVAKEKRIQRSGLKAFLVIAACVILAIVVLQLVSPVWIRNEVHRSPEKKVDFMVPSEDRSTGNVNESYAGKPLTTPLPAELVEGTPKPINVPNLEAPVDGPAGYSSWEDGEKGQVAGHADAGASGGFKKAKDRSVSADKLAESQKSTSKSDAGAAANPYVWSTSTPSRSPRPRAVPPPATEPQAPAERALAVQAEEMRRETKAERVPVLGGRTVGLADGRESSGEADPFADDGSASMDAGGKELDGGLRSDLASDRKNIQNQTETVSPGDSSSISLQKAIRDQEDKVEERRKLLATTVRTKGVTYKGTDSYYNQGGVDEDQGARSALNAYQQLESERMQLQSQVNSLLKYDSDQLMTYAAGLDLPDNVVREKLPQYQEAKRQIEALKIKGLGDHHPEVIAAAKQVSSMKSQLDEGVINARATLKAQLELADKRLAEVEKRKNETREEAIKRGLDAQDYLDAKRDFEADQELLQQLKLKLHSATKAAEPAKPKPDLSRMIEEIAATEDPYSTFSLNISDASFQIAQAALAKGERPDPAGINVEQFYNAVDYGDPAPSAGEPVAVNIEQSAHPIIPGRNLVRVALKTAAAGRSASQPLRLTLLVDQSGSMVREDRRAAMDKALAGLAGLLTDKDLVTVIGFSRTPRLLADGMRGDKAEKLAELVNQSASEGGTNLEEAIKLAGQKASHSKLAGAQNRIVLFTDGAANLGNADPARLAESVKQLRQKGIAFDIAGIAAEDLNDDLLGDLARNGNGRYYVVGKGGDDNLAKQLAGAFRPAAENVKVQVRFNPERVGRYKLIGFEKDRLKTEDFRNDSVDAAELAAEEAGVAVYQVEPLPGGKGELGEVSVRFRDAASAQMVERTWTIPHDNTAPVLDRATPSMQLAVLSMLAAEKLKGGPLGEAIDMNEFVKPRANVRQFYGHNVRVTEMLGMMDSLK